MKRIIVAIGLVLLLTNAGFAETKKASTSIADLQKEITRLKAELAACKNSNNSTASVQRTEAIASLRAVRSALKAGANFQEFKKYHIESKIKIDNLPDVPENKIIRTISDIYDDAITFGIVRTTGVISQSEIDTAKTKYKDHEFLSKMLADMKPNDSSRGLTYELNQNGGNFISKMILYLKCFYPWQMKSLIH